MDSAKELLKAVVEQRHATTRYFADCVIAQELDRLDTSVAENVQYLERLIADYEETAQKQPECDQQLFEKYNALIEQFSLQLTLPSERPSTAASDTAITSGEKSTNKVAEKEREHENKENASASDQAASVKASQLSNSEPLVSMKKHRFMVLISAIEFNSLQPYLKRSMKLDELNEIALKFNDVLMEKLTLQKKPYRQLTQKEKERVDKWREQVTGKTGDGPFCLAEDLRPGLSDKARANLEKCAIPVLRHLKRIREERVGPKTYYFPTIGC